jgi:hypothetical protein
MLKVSALCVDASTIAPLGSWRPISEGIGYCAALTVPEGVWAVTSISSTSKSVGPLSMKMRITPLV